MTQISHFEVFLKQRLRVAWGNRWRMPFYYVEVGKKSLQWLQFNLILHVV